MEDINYLIKDMEVSYKFNNGDTTEIFLIGGVEEYYARFIGIDISNMEDGNLKLSQTGIIDRIIAVIEINYETNNTRSELAANIILYKDENGASRK